MCIFLLQFIPQNGCVSDCMVTEWLGFVLSRHAVRVSPQFSHRMVEAARSVLNRYIPDIYIHTDVYKGEDSGKWVVLQSKRSSEWLI